MAIDLYSQQEETPTWKKILLLSGIILVSIVLIVFLFNQFSKIPKGNIAIAEINFELNKQGTAEQLEKQKLVLAAEKKINKFKELSNTKLYFNSYFDAFEGWVYPRVSFLSASIDAGTAEVILKGKTDTLQSVMEEMILLDAQSDVLSYTISNIIVDTAVTFDLNLKVNPTLFKQENTK